MTHARAGRGPVMTLPTRIASRQQRRPLAVTVARSPQQTVYLRMCAAFRSRLADNARRGAPAAVDAFALRPCTDGRVRRYVPDVTVPIVDRADVTVAEQVAALRSYPERLLVEELVRGGHHLGAWRHVARNPRRWLDGYADACWTAWQRLEPEWLAARHLIDRETERVGVAAVRGRLPEVLNSLSRRLSFDGTAFRLDDDGVCALEDRELFLVPSLIPPAAVMIHCTSDVLTIAYPLRGQGTLARAVAGPPTDRLALILGEARAAILRQVTVPLTMGEIATHLGFSPAAATRHCDLLERAGLVVRARRGRSVLVRLTGEGREVLDLLGDPAGQRGVAGSSGSSGAHSS